MNGRNFTIGPGHPAYAFLAAYHASEDVDYMRNRLARLQEAYDDAREILVLVAERLRDAELSDIVAEMEHV